MTRWQGLTLIPISARTSTVSPNLTHGCVPELLKLNVNECTPLLAGGGAPAAQPVRHGLGGGEQTFREPVSGQEFGAAGV